MITCCADRTRYYKIFKYFSILIFFLQIGTKFFLLSLKAIPYPLNNKGQYPSSIGEKIDKIGETLEQLQRKRNIPRLKDTSLFLYLSKGKQLSPCMFDPIGTGREILGRNRQCVRLHSVKHLKNGQKFMEVNV